MNPRNPINHCILALNPSSWFNTPNMRLLSTILSAVLIASVAAPVMAQEDNEPTINTVPNDVARLSPSERTCREKYNLIGQDLRYNPAGAGKIRRCKQLIRIENMHEKQGTRQRVMRTQNRFPIRSVGSIYLKRFRDIERKAKARRIQTGQDIQAARSKAPRGTFRNIRNEIRRSVRKRERKYRRLIGVQDVKLSSHERRRQAAMKCRKGPIREWGRCLSDTMKILAGEKVKNTEE